MPESRIFLVLVDDSKELKIALKFACLRANSTGGRVALAYVIEPSSGGNWMSIEELSREESRADAERILETYSKQVNKYTGKIPSLFIREGNVAEEFAKLVDEETFISIAVLAANANDDNPGPVISYLMGKGICSMRVPITIVPGNMKNSVLEDLA